MAEGRLGQAVGGFIAGLMAALARRPAVALGFALLLSSAALVEMANVRFEESEPVVPRPVRHRSET